MSPMRALEPTSNPRRWRRTGLMGVILVVLVTAVGQNFAATPLLFARTRYYGQFTDTGGLNEGDKVRITGVDVGEVQSVKIQGYNIVVRFTTGDHAIGTESRLSIGTDTILGKKVLEIEPRGTQMLRGGAMLPLEQGAVPYEINDAIGDASKDIGGWDVNTVVESLRVLSETVEQTSPHLSAALAGVSKFSGSIGKRDEQIKHLLGEVSKVTGLLGVKGDQVDRLLVNTGALVGALNQRGQVVDALLGNLAAVSARLQGVIDDNPQLNTVLQQLSDVGDVLVKRKENLVDGLDQLQKYYFALNEVIASGPYFRAMVPNLIPGWVSQPWLDAAFKKRGLSPEEFWKSAGLPAFRWPDPNGARFANGAPPPAPTVLEGTPEHPGPAVVPGTPCSFAPGAGNFPTPGDPLPCAGLDASQGPFGPHGGLGPYPQGLPDVLTSPPNPDGLPSSPGIPVAGRPGEVPPVVPGTPVPLPPDAPPGSRAEPIGPVSGPAEGNPNSPHWGTPGDTTLPPPTGPLGTGPGNQVPVPQIPPGRANSQPGGGGGSVNEGR